jgi:hypothetical protein
MSMRYKGGIISATPPTTSQSSAGGVWTLEQQLQANASGAWPVNGPFWIEDVFSTYLYTGNGSTQTITNGVDLSTYGGMVWTKSRSAVQVGRIYDSARGTNKNLIPSLTDAQGTDSPSAMNFSSSGFGLVADNSNNQSGTTYASWTFREQPKFFDVVTYTGNSVAGRTISHNLGSVPGCIIVKNLTNAANWEVYHRSAAAAGFTAAQSKLNLNTTGAVTDDNQAWNGTAPTSTVFSVGDGLRTNQSGSNYVAYLFAHDAGGFGAAGTDNVITCGSYTGNGSTTGPTITLGYEPQWVLIKNISASASWFMFDNMRGMPVGDVDPYLLANTSAAEATGIQYLDPLATGFQLKVANGNVNASANDYIYIAIRRGPMRTPTSGTSVFSPVAQNGSGNVNVGFPTDLALTRVRASAVNTNDIDRLRGYNNVLRTNLTNAELTGGAAGEIGINAAQNSYTDSVNGASAAVYWNFRRAPGFFDVVCYTGTGSTTTITHNLTVTPELVITKSRSQALGWVVWTTSLPSTSAWIRLDTTDAVITSPAGYGGTFSASNYTISGTGPYSALNNSGSTYVAYLFATVAGVSKVGSYQGNGTSKTIDCGFTAGARFVMIKRTDSTGDWYVWDSARGIVAGNDPHLSLNTTAAEVTTDDSVDTDSSGFIVNQVAATNVNVNNATYIFLAIA